MEFIQKGAREKLRSIGLKFLGGGGAREKTDEYLVEFYNGTMVHSRKGYLYGLIVSVEYKGELNLYKRPVLVLIQIQQ